MYIIATIISIVGVLIATLTNLFEKNKRIKNYLIYTGMILAVAGILLGNYQKGQEDDFKNQKLNEQNANIVELKTKLNKASDSVYVINSTLRTEEKKKDSLRIVVNTINKQNDKLIYQATQIQRNELEHFIKNQLALQDVSERFGYRHFNQTTEELLINGLKKYTGNLNIMVSDAGQEGNAFNEQLIRIFDKSGWKINRSNGIFSTKVTDGILIGIDKEDSTIYNPTILLSNAMKIFGYKVSISKSRLIGVNLRKTTMKKKNQVDVIILPYSGLKE